MKTVPAQKQWSERLGSTLFLAALLHGVVILGVTFTTLPFEVTPLPALKVTLLVETGREESAPRDADYLANRNQHAAGAAAGGLRPTTALSATNDRTQAGDPTGTDAFDGKPREQQLAYEQVTTRGSSSMQANSELKSPDEASDLPRQAAVLIDQLAPQTLAAELDLTAQLPGTDGRSPLAAPSAQQSALAEYLDGWRRRVERIGTANFPKEFLGDLGYGKPTLEVVIRADGRLEDIVVRRSSGDRALDQAALKILQLAAPFEPLPGHVTAEYGTLRFAYDWDFSGG